MPNFRSRCWRLMYPNTRSVSAIHSCRCCSHQRTLGAAALWTWNLAVAVHAFASASAHVIDAHHNEAFPAAGVASITVVTDAPFVVVLVFIEVAAHHMSSIGVRHSSGSPMHPHRRACKHMPASL